MFTEMNKVMDLLYNSL